MVLRKTGFRGPHQLRTNRTTGLYKKLKRFAARRARIVARAGVVVDDYYTSALVQDALGDTASGVLRWDPSTKTLEAHARDVIATRTYHDCRRARRFRHESVDVLASDAPRAVMAEIETMLHGLEEDTVVDLPHTRRRYWQSCARSRRHDRGLRERSTRRA